MITATGLLLLFVLLAIDVPVAFALAISGAVGLYLIGGENLVLGIVGTSPLSTVSSFELITVPMFLLMAELVILSGVANDLFRAARVWVGRLPAGLAIATTVAGAGFGAISGSSTASAATLASTSIPTMIRAGYEPKLACGVVAISGTLAMLIPPSIALVLFGIIAEVSIGKLLIGGVVPGILVTMTIIATVWLLGWSQPGRVPRGKAYPMAEKLDALKVVGPMVVLMMAVTGVIYLGVATPSEAAGLGAFGALLVAIHARRLTFAGARNAVWRAARTSCMILAIVIGAKIFGYFLVLTQTTQLIVAWVEALDIAPWMILSIILFGYLILGCFLDQVAILVLTVPIVLPVILALGYDPVWFGVIVIVIAEVGLVTPPLGLNVFVVSRYTGRLPEEVFAGVTPHVIAHLLLVALLV